MKSSLKYSLLVSDIDGTLVADNKQIPDANREAIESFRNQGGYFTLATGRNYTETQKYIEELQLDLPVILCNGGLIYDPSHNQLTPVATIQREVIMDTITQLERLGEEADIFVYTQDNVYATHISPLAQEGVDVGGFSLKLIPDFDQLPHIPLLKIVVLAEPNTIFRIRSWFKTLHHPLDSVQSAAHCFEILPQGISKGNAIKQLTCQLNLSLHQCAVIGDHLNDLSMIEITEMNAAVANAHPRLIQAAKTLVPSNENAGVAHFIHHQLITSLETTEKL